MALVTRLLDWKGRKAAIASKKSMDGLAVALASNALPLGQSVETNLLPESNSPRTIIGISLLDSELCFTVPLILNPGDKVYSVITTANPQKKIWYLESQHMTLTDM